MLDVIANLFDLSKIDEPYDSNSDYLSEVTKWMDLKIYYCLEQTLLNSKNRDERLEKYRGLVFFKEDIVGIMDRLANNNPQSQHHQKKEVQLHLERLAAIKVYLDKRVQLTMATQVFLPMAYLNQLFELDEFEQHCVLLSLLPHLDKSYEKAFGYLQDDINNKHTTIALAIKLFNPFITVDLTVQYLGVLDGSVGNYFFGLAFQATTLSTPLVLEQRILAFIFDREDSMGDVKDLLTIFYPHQKLPPLIIDTKMHANLIDISNQHKLVRLHGPRGGGKRFHVKHLAKSLHSCVIFVPLNKLVKPGHTLDRVNLLNIMREVVLHRAILCITHGDELLEDYSHEGKSGDISKVQQLSQLINQLVDKAASEAEFIFLLSQENLSDISPFLDHQWVELELTIPLRLDRYLLWQQLGKVFPLAEDLDLHQLANKYHLTPGQVIGALNQANQAAVTQGSPIISGEKLDQACHKQLDHQLQKQATRVGAKFTLDDLILPKEQKQQLVNACNQVKLRHVVLDQWGFEEKLPYGKGLSMLFSGPPGTGKTMAAQVIAGELGLELYKIDLSQTVSKFIGETEKNLKILFDQASRGNAILFFDECDALMGKRSEVKDAHDKYANLETSYLLQKIEEYEGVSVLTTNFLQNIDNAFLRRIKFVVHFPFPDQAQRHAIWQSIFPAQAPLAHDVDFYYLANQFELSGGSIKNIALNAAFLAAPAMEPISMRHLLEAVKTELGKQGKVLLKEDFGPLGFYLTN